MNSEIEFNKVFFKGALDDRPKICREYYDFIYFVKFNENFFKIGRTNQLTSRLNDIKKKNGQIEEVALFGPLLSNINIEKNLIHYFQSIYQVYKGREYFTGDLLEAMANFRQFCFSSYKKQLDNLSENEIIINRENFRLMRLRDLGWSPSRYTHSHLSLLDPKLLGLRK